MRRQPDPQLVKNIEQANGLAGKLLADIPALAKLRHEWRRKAYRHANLGIFAAVFNVILATSDFPLWWISAAAAGIAVAVVWESERFVRTVNRQLRRPAAEQAARDIEGIWG